VVYAKHLLELVPRNAEASAYLDDRQVSSAGRVIGCGPTYAEQLRLLPRRSTRPAGPRAGSRETSASLVSRVWADESLKLAKAEHGRKPVQ
jgi:hypothetical protein